MSGEHLLQWAPYAAGILAFYTLPLLLLKRARSSAFGAAEVLAVIATGVFFMMSAFYLIGAGLVGPLSLADYAITIAVYVLPAGLVWLVWASLISLRNKHNG
ncbi:MAG: hypothetical protein AAF697_01365 [Pseudomonadota bacterium]